MIRREQSRAYDRRFCLDPQNVGSRRPDFRRASRPRTNRFSSWGINIVNRRDQNPAQSGTAVFLPAGVLLDVAACPTTIKAQSDFETA